MTKFPSSTSIKRNLLSVAEPENFVANLKVTPSLRVKSGSNFENSFEHVRRSNETNKKDVPVFREIRLKKKKPLLE